MANVAFKRGLSTALPQAGKAIDGVFYLTTDTNRLYVGNSSSNLVDLNRYIKTVESSDKLYPSTGVSKNGLAAGDFVWVKSGNMLLVCVDPNATTMSTVWTQINPPAPEDQNDDSDTTVTAATLSDTADANANTITINLGIDQTTVTRMGGKTYTSPNKVTASTTITQAELDSVLDLAVAQDVKSITDGAGLYNSGRGAKSDSVVNLKEGDNISIVVSGKNVTISADDTTYGLSALTESNKALVRLSGSDNGNSEVEFKSGNDAITVSAANDTVTYTHNAYSTTKNTSTAAPAHGSTFTAIDSITTDKGHVIAVNTKTVTLPANVDTKYDHYFKDNELVLHGTDSSTDEVKFSNGQDIVITTASQDELNIAHAAYTSPITTNTTVEKPAHGDEVTVVESISTSNGHVNGIQLKKIQLPADANTKNQTMEIEVGDNKDGANSAGSIYVKVTDSDNQFVEARADDVLYYTINGQKVYNQGSFDFYTKSEIDGKIHAVNAMVYKGTVSKASDLPTVTSNPKPQVGWTYKVAVAGTYGGHECDIGDLLIAKGTETNGVITTDLTWDYVPSGDDTDTHYDLSARAVSNEDAVEIVLGNDVDTGETSAVIAGGTAINVGLTDGDIVVSHENVTRTDPTKVNSGTIAHGSSFDVVSAVTTNAQGHVTAVATKSFTLPTDNDTKYDHSALTRADGKKVVRLHGSDNSNDDVEFAAGTQLTVTAADDVVTYSHGSITTTPSSDSKTVVHGGTFDVIDSVTVGTNGHVTGYNTKTITLPGDNNTTYDLSLTEPHTITLSGSDGSTDKIALTDDGNYIFLSDNFDTDPDSINIAHKTYTATTLGSSTTTDQPLSHGGNFTAAVGVTRDSGGHVTGVTTCKFILPADNDTKYDLSGHTTVAKTVSGGTGATISTVLTGSDNSSDTATFDLTSTSLQVTAGTKAVAVDLVWGSFTD